MNKTQGRKKSGAKFRQVAVLSMGALLSVAAKVAPQGVATIVLRLAFTPARMKFSERASAAFADATMHSNVVDGSKVAHYAWGKGDKCVLLVHGWSGNAGQMATIAQTFIEQGFRVLAIDFPGHGKSAGGRTSVIHFERVIANANKLYGPFQAVVAHSMGAAAVTYAFARGLACERAVFIAPVSSLQGVWSRIQSLFGISPQLVDLTRRRAEAWLNISFADIEPMRLAPRLATELLVIHDRQDKECPITDSEALIQAWPGARLLITSKLGHTRILGDEEVSRACAEFITASANTKSRDFAQPYGNLRI